MRYYLCPTVTYGNDGSTVTSAKIRQYTDDWNTRWHLYGGSDVIVACDPDGATQAAIEADEDIEFLWGDNTDFAGMAQGQGNGSGLLMAEIARINGLLAPRGIVLQPADTRNQVRQKVFGA